MSDTTTSTELSAERLPVWRHGLLATVAAAAAVAGVAGIAMALGVDFVPEEDPRPIPILGFVQLTVIFSLIGVGLAAILARTTRHPRRASEPADRAISEFYYIVRSTAEADIVKPVAVVGPMGEQEYSREKKRLGLPEFSKIFDDLK